MKLILALLLALWFTPTHAATYYYSDCGTGADVNCVVGNDTTPGTCTLLAPCRTYAHALNRMNTGAPLDIIVFARGGAWNNVQGQIQNLSSSAANPMTYDAYTPSWCTGACLSVKPILNGASGVSALPFDDGSTPEADAGYVIQNLDLRGAGTGLWGVFTSQLASDITIRNMTITGFAIGVHCGVGIKRVKILYSTIDDNTEQGILSGCDDTLIEGNTLDNNGFIAGIGESDDHYHNIYLGLVNNYNVTIRGNTLTDNSRLTNQCRSPSLVVHGTIRGLVIENNYIYQSTTTIKDNCYAIAVDTGYPGTAEAFIDVAIRGNVVVNGGSVAIGCAGCVRPVIENNVVVYEAPTGTGSLTAIYGAIAVPSRVIDGLDTIDTGSAIRNNSVYFAYGPAVTRCITYGEGDPSNSAGTGLQNTNNLCFFSSAVASTHECYFLGDRVIGNFTASAFTNNLCFHQGGNGRWSSAYATLAAARIAGFDTGPANLDTDPALTVVPTLANGWSMKVNSGSLAINNGNATYKAPNAIKGYPAVGGRDIGAFEFGSNPE